MLVVVVDVRMRLPVSQFVARVPEESALAEVCFAAVADRTFTHHAAAVPHWGEWAVGRTKNTYVKKNLILGIHRKKITRLESESECGSD